MATEEHEENIIRAFTRVDALLSAAEDIVRKHLTTIGNRAEYPHVARVGDAVNDQIERARAIIHGRPPREQG